MKRLFYTAVFMLLASFLSASFWDTITNTNHIYEIGFRGENLLLGTWGGAVELEPAGTSANPDYSLKRVWTTGDGLISNDMRHLGVAGENLWLGSYADGISIVNPLGFQSLDLSLGLPSEYITGIAEYGSKILVATAGGLAEYYYLPGVNFPLLLHLYNQSNTSGGLLSNEISQMLVLDNYAYLATELGISYVHVDSLNVDSAWGSWLSSELPPGMPAPYKLASGGGRLVIGSINRVIASDGALPYASGWEVFYPSVNEPISALGIDGEGRAWIAYGSWNENLSSFTTAGDLLLEIYSNFPYEHLLYLKSESGLGVKTISDIKFRGTDVYLASWGEGFYRKVGENWISFKTNSIAFPKITAIATDHEHNPWFVSGYISSQPVKKGSLGVSYLEDGIWSNFTLANSGLHNDSANTVLVDSVGRIWFGAWDTGSNHPLGWTNGITIYDPSDGKWRTLNSQGVREYDPETGTYGALIPGMATLYGNTIGGLSMDTQGRVFVASYDRGFNVINPDLTLHSRFTIENSTGQRVIYHYDNGRQHFFGTNNDAGLVIWNHPSIPVSDGDHWLVPDPPELSGCIIYGVATIETPFYGTQHWIAASNGLFMWDESSWYRYTTTIKRYRYNTSTNSWVNDQLYYADEERLYGSESTFPASMLLDPFGRIWIGTLDHGISMYNPDTDRFTNYFPSKDPLLSGYITALGYEPENGLLYIGTPDGLNSLKIGRFIKPETSLEELKAYPNPFRPEQQSSVQIVNLPADSMPRGANKCRIFDSSGRIVAELEENEFSRFVWDGKSPGGSAASSGIYFFVVTDSAGNSKRGKFALIR